MNKLSILFIVIAAFITAAAFSLIRSNAAISPEALRMRIQQQKASRMGCTTAYLPSAADPIPALTGWGNYQWKITTNSDSAQFYFNQGINMYYSFHIIEARASFDKATNLDSACAMAWWGKALAFGPNINDFGYLRPSEAYPSSVKARELSEACSASEKALIEALAVRYSPDTAKNQSELNVLYTNAMADVYRKHRGRADIAALYADALMLLHPWDLYDHESRPKPWTTEIVKVLEDGLSIWPEHPGANHYYIHAVEASSEPEKALKSANILSQSMPEIAHITHMPSHIYIRTGNYEQGIDVNDKAVAGFIKHRRLFPAVNENLPLYSLHNSHMKVNCAQMAGNYERAISAAKQLQQDIPSDYINFGGPVGHYIQYLHQSTTFTLLRFGRWDEILATQVDDSLAFTPVIQRFARGIALARTNKLAAAKSELGLLRSKMAAPVLKEPLTPFNSAFDASQVAAKLLAGVIAEQEKDYSRAIVLMQEAVDAEDKMIYNEPRDWMLPARQFFGNVLLKAKKYKEAEAVFLKDLSINPNNGWSLTGLKMTFEAQGLKPAAAKASARIDKAWVIKDVSIERPVF